MEFAAGGAGSRDTVSGVDGVDRLAGCPRSAFRHPISPLYTDLLLLVDSPLRSQPYLLLVELPVSFPMYFSSLSFFHFSAQPPRHPTVRLSSVTFEPVAQVRMMRGKCGCKRISDQLIKSVSGIVERLPEQSFQILDCSRHQDLNGDLTGASVLGSAQAVEVFGLRHHPFSRATSFLEDLFSNRAFQLRQGPLEGVLVGRSDDRFQASAI